MPGAILFRFDSDLAVDLNICDSDPLFGFIRSSGLAIGDFSDAVGEELQGRGDRRAGRSSRRPLAPWPLGVGREALVKTRAVVRDGAVTAERPGRALRGPGYQRR